MKRHFAGEHIRAIVVKRRRKIVHAFQLGDYFILDPGTSLGLGYYRV